MYAKYSELRDSKGLNDSKVAKLTGIPKSTFSDWKNGRSSPKIPKLMKIAKCLDASIEELCEGDKV